MSILEKHRITIEVIYGFFNRWFTKGVRSITDQAIFASTNFLVTILLARFLTQSSFGVFAFIYSIYLFVSMAYRSFFHAPMLYFGSKKFVKVLPAYLNKLIWIHWSGTLILIFLVLLILSITILWTGFSDLQLNVVVVTISFPCMLYFLLMRRACYVILKPHLSALGSVLNSVLVLLGLFLFWRLNMLSVSTAFLTTGVAGVLGGVFIQIVLNYGKQSGSKIDLAKIGLEHWQYGKWLVVASGMSWISGQSFYGLLFVFDFISESGTLKALMVLVQPIFQIHVGLSALLTPVFVRAIEKNGGNRAFLLSSISFILISIAYSIFLVFMGEPILSLIYGAESPYVSYYTWIPLLSLLPIFHAMITVFGTWLQAINRTRSLAKAYFMSAVVAISIGSIAIPSMEVGGAIVGLILSLAVSSIMMFFIIWRWGAGILDNRSL